MSCSCCQFRSTSCDERNNDVCRDSCDKVVWRNESSIILNENLSFHFWKSEFVYLCTKILCGRNVKNDMEYIEIQ